MNPKIPADHEEVGRWLHGFATSHGKRETPRLEARLEEMEGGREAGSYGLRLVLGTRTWPPAGEPPIELSYSDVREGRTRFAWCEALAERIRRHARELSGAVPPGGSRTG